MYGLATSCYSLTSLKNESNLFTTSFAVANGSTFIVILPVFLRGKYQSSSSFPMLCNCYDDIMYGFAHLWPLWLSILSLAVLLDIVLRDHHSYRYHFEPCWISFFVTIRAIMIVTSPAGFRFFVNKVQVCFKCYAIALTISCTALLICDHCGYQYYL